MRGCYPGAHGTCMRAGLQGPGLRSSEAQRPESDDERLNEDRVLRAQAACHRPCRCAQGTTVLCFQHLGWLCDRGYRGPAPNCVPWMSPKEWAEAHAQGSQGTSSLESMILARQQSRPAVR